MFNQVGEDIGGSIEVYDPGLNQWRMQGTMQDARLVGVHFFTNGNVTMMQGTIMQNARLVFDRL